ncbi:MAG TPA: tetratricopeptide repeat protein [Kofleriaceae bacterium]
MKLAIAMALALAMGSGCLDSDKNDAINLANEGSKAYGAKQWDTAIEKYKKATEKWPDHHMAWYGMAGAYNKKSDFKNAADAAGKAVKIAGDQAMYHQFYGLMLYEKAVFEAKDELSKKEDKKIEDVKPDLGNINFETSLKHLQEAVKLNPDLWKAHYGIGRIHRDKGNSKEAAEALTKALQGAPTESAPWVALAELYLLWDYADQAIQVASQAATVIPGENEKGEAWYLVGRGYDDKMLHDKAIEAYDKALESRRDLQIAKFQRGQAYFRKGVFDKAKRDLEEFSKSGGKSAEFAKQQASRMLMEIAIKTSTPPSGGGPVEAPGQPRLSPEDAVKKAKEEKEKKGG